MKLFGFSRSYLELHVEVKSCGRLELHVEVERLHVEVKYVASLELHVEVRYCDLDEQIDLLVRRC